MMVNKLTPHMKTLARKNRKDLTGPEIKLWFELREFKQIGAHFRKQVPIFPSPSWGGIEGGGSLNKNAARKSAPRKTAL